MPAAATARKPAPRARRAARPVPRRAPRPAPRPAPRLVPVAVGRTAVAVGGIADSGLVLRLTRSRLWIGVLGSLLVGIVALNVFALSFNASSSKTAGIADELRRENSALRAQIEDGLSNQRLLQAASRAGLIVPEPGAVLYLDPDAADAAAASKRLRNGRITIGSEYVPPPVVPIPEAPPVTDPAATATATTEVPAETPAVTEAPPAPDPATTGTAPAAGGGITP